MLSCAAMIGRCLQRAGVKPGGVGEGVEEAVAVGKGRMTESLLSLMHYTILLIASFMLNHPHLALQAYSPATLACFLVLYVSKHDCGEKVDKSVMEIVAGVNCTVNASVASDAA